jgi:hypothetical protein
MKLGGGGGDAALPRRRVPLRARQRRGEITHEPGGPAITVQIGAFYAGIVAN